MKIFLAGMEVLKSYPDEIKKSKYQLASFYSLQEWQIPFLKECDDFLLDSGAFSFMNGAKKVDFDAYLERYAEFINKHKFKHFFELDIDSVVGYPKVLEMRNKLEKLTGRRCIPVWHKARGVNDFIEMCKDYDYVAIGGIVTKEIKPYQYTSLIPLIDKAHLLGTKVHGLGFTSTSYFDRVRFDTVDSTTWNVGGKFGNICVFSSEDLMKQRIQKKGKRCVEQSKLMLHNYNEWIKFQRYAETNL